MCLNVLATPAFQSVSYGDRLSLPSWSRNQTRAAFETLVNAELPARVGLEVDAILGGKVPT